MRLNGIGFAHAKELIKQGKIDFEAAWSFDAEDGNRILGDPPNWKEYEKWFLGIRDDENPETKARFAYPFGKDGKVFRSAIIAIKQRAAQQQHLSIAKAADTLFEMIDGNETARVKVSVLSADGQSFSQWVQLIPLGHVKTVDGREFVMDETDGRQILDRFKARVTDLPITVEHIDMLGAVGWLRALELRLPKEGAEQLPEHGLWGLIEWTSKGTDFLAQKAFRSMSPEIILDKRKPPHAIELLGASLVVNPALDGLALVASRENLGGKTMEKEHEKDQEHEEALKAKLSFLEKELDKAQDELAKVREQLASERMERKIAELKASKLLSDDLEKLGRDIMAKAGEELFLRWAQTLPERKAPATGRIGEPERPEDDSLTFLESFPGEKALMSRAKKMASEKGLTLAQALERLVAAGGEK